MNELHFQTNSGGHVAFYAVYEFKQRANFFLQLFFIHRKFKALSASLAGCFLCASSKQLHISNIFPSVS